MCLSLQPNGALNLGSALETSGPAGLLCVCVCVCVCNSCLESSQVSSSDSLTVDSSGNLQLAALVPWQKHGL